MATVRAEPRSVKDCAWSQYAKRLLAHEEAIVNRSSITKGRAALELDRGRKSEAMVWERVVNHTFRDERSC